MGPEAQLERKVRQAAEAAGGLCLKLTALPGIPDRLLILPEDVQPRFIFVEMKARSGRLSRIQKMRIARLKALGADVRVVRGPEETEELIAEIKGGDTT